MTSAADSVGRGPTRPRELHRRWEPGHPIDLRRTLAPLRRGSADPAHISGPDGFWWAAETPVGAGALRLMVASGSVTGSAWGAGAEWLLEQAPALIGGDDDWSTLDVSPYPGLVRLLRSHSGLRLPKTGLVLDSLVPAILEQRVTGLAARAAWRSLLWAYGEPAPGPVPAALRVPPAPAVLLQVPTWDWSRWDVDIHRQRAIRAAATVAARLEECVAMSWADAAARLRVVPGVGVWTAAETTQRAMGDADAVSVNDFHLHNQVVYALTGRPRGSDEEMLALLEPWKGQRQRVVRLIEVAGIGAPRFGPRQHRDRVPGS